MTLEEIFEYTTSLRIGDVNDTTFDNAIIGLSSDNKLIYDYEKMVDCLVDRDGCDYFEAMEFIDRTIDYLNEDDKPIILVTHRE